MAALAKCVYCELEFASIGSGGDEEHDWLVCSEDMAREARGARPIIERLTDKIKQIIVVIDDNAATGDKKMTLDFIRQIATSK